MRLSLNEEIYYCDPSKDGCGNVELMQNCPIRGTGIHLDRKYHICPRCRHAIKDAGTLITGDNYPMISSADQKNKALELLVVALTPKGKQLNKIKEMLGLW